MTPSNRDLTLDAVRGATIAAMIVVNTPGTWSAVYPPLRHAAWHGLTPTDLIFPGFLFMVGISIAFAYGRIGDDAAARHAARRKILVRSAKLFALGLLLNLWPEFDFTAVRFAGVLQRIAVVFLVVALLHFALRPRSLLALAVTLLVVHWAALTLVPVPRDAVISAALATGSVERAHGEQVQVTVAAQGDQAVAPNLEPGTNLGAWLDRRLLPGVQYERTWDPEGWLSTVPALATGLLGLVTGGWLRRYPDHRARLPRLATAAVVTLLFGYTWSWVLPLNKNLWTGSFVLVAAGWSLALLAAVQPLSRHGVLRPFVVFGTNAITAYALAALLVPAAYRPWLDGRSPAELLVHALVARGVSAELASLVFAGAYTAVIFLPIALLYRRRIFLRL